MGEVYRKTKRSYSAAPKAERQKAYIERDIRNEVLKRKYISIMNGLQMSRLDLAECSGLKHSLIQGLLSGTFNWRDHHIEAIEKGIAIFKDKK